MAQTSVVGNSWTYQVASELADRTFASDYACFHKSCIILRNHNGASVCYRTIIYRRTFLCTVLMWSFTIIRSTSAFLIHQIELQMI